MRVTGSYVDVMILYLINESNPHPLSTHHPFFDRHLQLRYDLRFLLNSWRRPSFYRERYFKTNMEDGEWRMSGNECSLVTIVYGRIFIRWVIWGHGVNQGNICCNSYSKVRIERTAKRYLTCFTCLTDIKFWFPKLIITWRNKPNGEMTSDKNGNVTSKLL